jgi:hypothetical protein
MALVVEPLPSKCKALSPNHSTAYTYSRMTGIHHCDVWLINGDVVLDVLLNLPRLALKCDPPISASQVAGIIGMRHLTQSPSVSSSSHSQSSDWSKKSRSSLFLDSVNPPSIHFPIYMKIKNAFYEQ